MTVSTTQNRITYNGNGVTTVFAFPYKFIETSDLVVYVGEVLQAENVDYTVGTPSDSGANITFSSAPTTGTSNVVILRDPDLLQETDLPTNGRLPADAIERMVDKVTLVAQRLRDLLDRTIRRNDADPANSTLVLPVAVANKALIFDENGELAVGVDDYLDQAANAASSAASASASAIAAEAIYDDFDDRYLGSKTSDPTLDNDGAALLVGALYWNSVTNKLRIYNGASWQDTATATPASFTSNMYSGTGAQTAFTLSTTPASSASVVVSVSGVLQRPTTDYSVSGTTLTFVAAPPLGTNNVLALVASTVAAGTPDNDSVSTAKIQDGAVTSAKIGGLAVLTANIANAAVSLSKLVANIFDGATVVTPAIDDYVVISDTSDSGNTKKSLVSAFLSLITKVTVRAATATTSGTTAQYTGVSSSAWKITGKLASCQKGGTSGWIVQVGDSGGFKTSGYLGSESTSVGASALQNSTGFAIKSNAAAGNILHGTFEIELLDAATNTWVFSSNIGLSNTTQVGVSGGSVVLSGTLDRIRLTSVSGDTFTAGLFGITEHLT